MQVLPEVTRDRWDYSGEAEVGDKTVDTWVFKSEPSKGYGHYVSNYTFSVTKVGVLHGCTAMLRDLQW